jgi:hypothetical protein
MKVLTVFALLAPATAALAQPPPRELFEDNAVSFRAEVARVELTQPYARLHVKDQATGRLWVVEGASHNTLTRSGLTAETMTGELMVTGFPSKDKSCAPECRLRMRELTFPDGRKVFLGSSGTGRS